MDQKIRLVGTIANLITFTYKNKNYYYTNYHSNITSNGRKFTAMYNNISKIKASAVKARADVDVEVDVESDIANIVNFAETSSKINVVIEECYTNAPNTTSPIWWGVVSDNVTNGTVTKITCTPINLIFEKQSSVYTYMSVCNHTLGRGFCTVSLDAFTFTAQVVDLLDGGLTITLSRTVPPGFVDAPEKNKYIEMGALKKGNEMKTIVYAVNSTANSNIKLKQKIQNLKIGDTVELIPGCDGRSSTCKVKFNNFKDYFGFETVPSINPFKKLK